MSLFVPINYLIFKNHVIAFLHIVFLWNDFNNRSIVGENCYDHYYLHCVSKNVTHGIVHIFADY